MFHGSTLGREQTQPNVVSLSVSRSEPYTQIVLICLRLQTALPFPFVWQCIMGGQRPSALCQTQVNSASVPLSMSALLFEDFIIPKEGLFSPGGTFFCFCGVCEGSCSCRRGFQHHGQSCQELHSLPPPSRLASLCVDRQRVAPLQQLPSSSCWGLSRMLMDT